MGSWYSLRTATLLGGVAVLGLFLGCGSGSTASPATGPTSAQGAVNIAITDAPSDSWQEVSVVLNSAALLPKGQHANPQTVWTADPANPAKINLVDLNSVADILSKATVPEGTYDLMVLTINTDPTTMTLVDDSGNTIPSSVISVVGNGAIKVTIDPALQVVAGVTTNLQLDFDLSHPLSIVQETVGGVLKVVLNLQVHHKPLPPRVRDLQFTRKLGQVTATDATSFTLTDTRSATFTYQVDTSTLYQDVDAKAAGNLAGLSVGKYALVAANLNADGTLYARRVWYAATAEVLPTCTPEGLIRRVNQNSFSIYSSVVSSPNGRHSHWATQNILVDASTAFTFHGTTAMGTGPAMLQNLWRGCRVDVQFDSAGTTATIVNVHNAHDEGLITSATATGVTFGWPGLKAPSMASSQPDFHGRTWSYYLPTGDPAGSFSWWYFGLPSAASTVIQDFTDTITAATTAGLPVQAYANLFWDTTSSSWQVYQLVLSPEQLAMATITTGYTDGPVAGSGTLAVSYLDPMDPKSKGYVSNLTQSMTVTLDATGDLQTVVESNVWDSANRVFTTTVPVPSAQWSTLLVPPAAGSLSLTRIWVRPVKNGTAFDWHAYNVQVFSVK